MCEHCDPSGNGNENNYLYDIILDKKKIISILVDESTTLSRKTTLAIVLRTFFETFPGEPYTFNLDLIELCSTSAE